MHSQRAKHSWPPAKLRWISILPHCLTLVAVAALALFVQITWSQQSAYSRWKQQVDQTFFLRSEIDRLDQVLTVNAILAAATGDPKWVATYRANEPILDKVLSDARELSSGSDAAGSIGGLPGVDATTDANQTLVDMEHRAMALAALGKRSEAVEVLASEKYAREKARYHAGLQLLNQALQQFVAEKSHSLAEESYWLGLSAILGLALTVSGSALIFVESRSQARRLQGALAENRERLELAIGSADLALWDWNIATGEVVFSDRFATMLGYEAGELEPFIGTWERLLHPSDRAAAVATTERAREQPDFQYADQYRLRSRDGNWKTVMARGRVVARAAAGSPARLVGTFLDVTERVELEAQLFQAQKLESIGQLAAGIAHEINTPMQFVSDNIEFLEDCSRRLFAVVDAYDRNLAVSSAPRSWEERWDELGKVIRENRFDKIRQQVPQAIAESMEGIQRVINIVRAMKEFSHPGQEQKVGVDLNNAVSSTVTISRNRWKYAAEMDLDLDPDLPTLRCVPAEINQVLLNLIVNAADAIVEKVGENSGEKGTITVRTRRDQDEIIVEVEDTGCGIPEAIRSRIFDPFFTTKEVGKGTGQGLAICYNVVVNKHHGALEVESTPGMGTVFRAVIPIGAVPPPDDQSEGADEDTASAPADQAVVVGVS